MTASRPSNQTLSLTSARLWLSPRRRRFWAVLVVLLYTLAGFFVVPWVARTQVVEQLEAILDVPVQLEEFRFNPWTLQAEATGFAVGEPGITPIVGFERLVVNLQISSVFRWALTLAEVRLEKPHGYLARLADGTLNIDPLLAAALGDETPTAETENKDTGGGLPRLLIGELVIAGGAIDIRDWSLATPFATSVGPIDIDVSDLSTLPDRAGRQRVSVSTERGTRLEWSGTLGLEPLISDGRVTASGPYLPLLYQYFQDQLNFELTDAAVESSIVMEDSEVHGWRIRDSLLGRGARLHGTAPPSFVEMTLGERSEIVGE